jgi:hypothetical protein
MYFLYLKIKATTHFDKNYFVKILYRKFLIEHWNYLMFYLWRVKTSNRILITLFKVPKNPEGHFWPARTNTVALEDFLINPERFFLVQISYKRAEIASFFGPSSSLCLKFWPLKHFWSTLWPTFEKGWPPLAVRGCNSERTGLVVIRNYVRIS